MNPEPSSELLFSATLIMKVQWHDDYFINILIICFLAPAKEFVQNNLHLGFIKLYLPIFQIPHGSFEDACI